MSDLMEGKRQEYAALRAEIRDADRTCVLLMGFLLAATTAVYVKVFETVANAKPSGTPSTSTAGGIGVVVLLAVLTALWVWGILQVADKRLLILRIAFYLRTYVESRSAGMSWETWMQLFRKSSPQTPVHGTRPQERANGQILPHAALQRRWEPFYLEIALTIIVLVANAVILI